jgi:hypothetical protein
MPALHVSIRSIILKILIPIKFDKLMYSFNIVITYVCTDKVHSDNHHHIIVTVVHICK